MCFKNARNMQTCHRNSQACGSNGVTPNDSIVPCDRHSVHYREWVINLEKFSHLSVFHLEECPFVVKPAQHFRRGQKCTFKSRKVLLQSPRSTSWICSWVLLLSKYRTIFVGNLFSSCHWWVPFCLPDPVEYSDHVSNNLHPSNFEHGSCRISSK